MYMIEDIDVIRTNELHHLIKWRLPWFADAITEQLSYEEFQIQKYWASRIDLIDKNVNILNSGIGYFAVPFCYEKGVKSLEMFDMDPTTVDVSWSINNLYDMGENFIHHQRNVTFDYNQIRRDDVDVFINTSCEHSYPMHTLLEARAKDKLCVMSGNNLTKRGHINLINSIEELKEQCQLSEIINEDVMEFEYEDDLGKRTYQQFFIIGIK